jgi:DNA repair protein RecN (Recombination protein N)
MLTSLKIENVAIIENAAIEFGCGLNVLTGETGAGKSIVIDSINAVLGERTSKDIIRTGADSAKVYAVFEEISDEIRSVLDENGIDCEEDILIISRTINRDGKNVCRINGCPVTVGMLKIIGKSLIDIHGQHDSQALLSPERHCGFVDGFARRDDLLEAYKTSFRQLCEIRKKIAGLKTDESSKSQRIDFLTYQINELEMADIVVGEKASLLDKKNLINNSQRVIESLNSAYHALKGESAGIDSVCEAYDSVSDVQNYYTDLNEPIERLNNIRYELEDIAEVIRDSLYSFDFDDHELDSIEERLDVLYRLSRKYGETEEEMLEYLDKAKAELDNITFSEEKLNILIEEEGRILRKTANLADELTRERKSAGEELSLKICDELNFLDMPNVKFAVKCDKTELSENGQDEIEFLISANAGEEPKPLAKIASGGELSRIMLAIKNVLADLDDVGTMIFDEIDTGVSGRAAQKIALKLREVSKGRQVLCVTHLAQIASQGDVHLYISKSVKDGKTFTNIKSLFSEDRVAEIARIMGGIEITELQLSSAREMLLQAGNILL